MPTISNRQHQILISVTSNYVSMSRMETRKCAGSFFWCNFSVENGHRVIGIIRIPQQHFTGKICILIDRNLYLCVVCE